MSRSRPRRRTSVTPVLIAVTLLSVAFPIEATTIVGVSIAASADDAEESGSGSVDLTSSDLELVTDGSKIQTVGLRWALPVPRAAVIRSARVQFQTDELSTDAAVLTIRGQADDNAAVFQAVARDVSIRPRTAAAVEWRPPPWDVVGAAGAAQSTPDLTAIVAEITGRAGWDAGNALALIVTGSGRRTAEAFDGAGGPVLHVEYEPAPPPNDTTPPTKPENLVAVATSATRVDLSWTVSSDDIGPVTYSIVRDAVVMGSTPSTTYADTPVDPLTRYAYRVIAADAAGNLSEPSDEAIVTTPALPAGVSFSAGGDYGASSATAVSLSVMDSMQLDFHIANGDFAYADLATEQEWCDWVLARIPTLGPMFPFELIVGDAETDSQPKKLVNYVACLPDRLGVTLSPTNQFGAEYFFDYPKTAPLMRMIAIGADQKVNGARYNYRPGNARYRWLASTIEGARSAGIPWVVVAMHEVCQSAGKKACSVGGALMDLLFAKNVDLIVQAHDHNYQRSKQIALNPDSCPSAPVGSVNPACLVDDGADDAYIKGAGSVFVINGAFGGRGLSAIQTADPEIGYFATLNSTTRGFSAYTVTADRLEGRFVNTVGTFTDTFTIRAP